MICPLCPRQITYNTLSYHLQTFHGRSNWSNYKCKAVGCPRSFGTVDSFKIHFKKCECYLKEGESHSSLSTSGTSDDSALDCSITNEPITNEPITDPLSNNNDGLSLEKLLHSLSDKFVSKLYSKSSLPRNHVQHIVDDVTELFATSTKLLKEDILQTVKDCVSSEKISEIEKSFEVFSDPFPHLSTEYRRLSYFTKSANFVSPVSIKVGTISVPKTTERGTVYSDKPCYVHSIPLRKVLKHFLEQPEAFDVIISYVSSLEKSENIENCMNCPLWKSKRAKLNKDDIVLPLFVNADDFQCNNALGFHCKFLGAVPASLACLPPEIQTSMKNIFLALLYQTSYRSRFGYETIFESLIAELTFLEKEGILISTSSGTKRVYFVTALLLGDTKGLNSLCGFVEAFTANHYCRFCRTHRTETYYQAIENISSLRNELSYGNDVKLNNYTETGVKFESAFNSIPSFSVTDNMVVDNFHDFAEGNCHYVLLHLLKNCIPKYFTLEVLNNRIAFFDYGPCESNRIPKISDNFASKEKLRLSGCETLLFCKVLGLLVGDLVPEEEPFWLLYIKLRELLDICFSKSAVYSQSNVLRVHVEEFNLMYVSVTKDTLKPKMHFLVHYPRALENCGPIDLMSTRKWESKHRSLTVPAHATSSRVDVTLTLSIRHQLTQCFQFLGNDSILPKFEVGPSEIVNVSDFEEFSFFKNVLSPSLYLESVLLSDWIEIKGSKYKPDIVLIVNANEHGPVFAQLKFIIVKDDIIFFISQYLLNRGFNSHVHAYPVVPSSRWCCHIHIELYDPLPLYAMSDIFSNKYVILRCSL